MQPNLLATSFEEIKQSIINRFRNNPTSKFKDWDYQGSGLNELIDVLSYVTVYNNYYLASTVNEMYLPYARMDKNVYALARSLGYLPKRPCGAIADISIDIDKLNKLLDYNIDISEDIIIPVYTKVKSEKGLKYILQEEIKLRADLSDFYKKNNKSVPKYKPVKNGILQGKDDINGNNVGIYYYRIKQGQLQYTKFNPSQQPLQRLLLENPNIDDAPDSIRIQDSITFDMWYPLYDISDFNLDTALLEYNPRNYSTFNDWQTDIINNSLLWDNYILKMGESKIFFLIGDESGLYVTFGDGNLGAIPENSLDIFYFLTDGSEGNGDLNFVFEGIVEYKRTDGSTGTFNLKDVLIIVKDEQSSYGGADAETTESIRQLSPASFNAQHRCVIDKDYETYFAQQKVVPLKNIKAIGGDKLKPIVMAAAGIVCNKATNYDIDIKNSILTENEKTLLKFICKNNNIITINPVFITPEFVKINVNNNVYYNPTKYTEDKVYTAVNASINTFFNNLGGYNKYFKKSNLTSLIDKMEEVDHSDISISMEYLKNITKKEISEQLYVNIGSENIIVPYSISTTIHNDYFLKIFNKNLKYNVSDIQDVSVVTSEYTAFKNKLIDENDNTKTVISKIFIYNLKEIKETDDLGKLYIEEQYVDKLQAISTSSGYSFQYVLKSTGKTKYIGDILYKSGLIRLYLTDTFFRHYGINKLYKHLAINTEITTNTDWVFDSIITKLTDFEFPNITLSSSGRVIISPSTERPFVIPKQILAIDSIDSAYKSYDDLFFYNYVFDESLSIPVTLDQNIDKYLPNDRIAIDNYWFEFSFKSLSENFYSMGNSIIVLGDTNYSFIKEVNKK
jgi:hypothetical protein